MTIRITKENRKRLNGYSFAEIRKVGWRIRHIQYLGMNIDVFRNTIIEANVKTIKGL